MGDQDFVMLDDNASDASSVTLDHDPDRLYLLRETSQTTTPLSSVTHDEVVDLTDDGLTQDGDVFHDGDYVTDEYFEVLLQNWQTSVPEANSSLRMELPDTKRLDEFCDDVGVVYTPGQSVELHDNTFLRICSIWEVNGETAFQGRRLWKLRARADEEQCDETYLPTWKKELIWVLNETNDVPLGLVKRFVPIHFTNHCRIQDSQKKGHQDLFCRLKEMVRKNNTSVEYLTYAEADDGFRVKPNILRSSWRGETASFGSNERYQSPVIVLDPTEDEDPVQEQKDKRKYTFGDGFCGAGGVSCGAESAGLYIKWAFDLSSNATKTYRLNFPTAECEDSDVFHFLVNTEEFLRVDITHGSPPCQTFSPAHTINGPNDDANSACIFSCGDLIEKAKPRIHTMEETSGLFERHQKTFFGVIHDFIEKGYSVRWALLNCMDFGVPQSRRRLVIIASGPGETLPSLPRPTHGLPGSGLRSLATINQVISIIPPGTPDHDVEAARARASASRVPFDANQQACTITCGGGQNNYHPSGTRGFTNREYACLQTFPLNFKFGKEVRKQIGNAVPPLLAKAIYGEIIKSLQETDERELREE